MAHRAASLEVPSLPPRGVRPGPLIVSANAMDRKVLLAMVMIMMVLLLDQVISPRFYRPKTKPVPSQQKGAPGQTGTQERPPVGAATSATGAGAGGTSGGEGTAAPGTPAGSGTAGSGTAGSGGALSSGTVLTKPQVAPAPTEIREIRTEHYRATFTSDGAAISHWTLDSYKDEVRNQPVDLVPPGALAYQVIVESGSRALDFSQAPFRLTQDDPLGGILSFEAQDVSGVRVTKTFRLGSDRRLLDASVRVSAPPELGPIRYRIGWGTPLPLTEPSTKHDQLQPVALLGAKLETVPA